MATSVLKYGGLLSVAIIVIAIVYKRNVDDQLRQRLDDVLHSLRRAEQKVSLQVFRRVGLSYQRGSHLL